MQEKYWNENDLRCGWPFEWSERHEFDLKLLEKAAFKRFRRKKSSCEPLDMVESQKNLP